MAYVERPVVRKTINKLLVKHQCGLEELNDRVFLFKGTRIEIRRMLKEKENESGNIL